MVELTPLDVKSLIPFTERLIVLVGYADKITAFNLLKQHTQDINGQMLALVDIALDRPLSDNSTMLKDKLYMSLYKAVSEFQPVVEHVKLFESNLNNIDDCLKLFKESLGKVYFKHDLV